MASSVIVVGGGRKCIPFAQSTPRGCRHVHGIAYCVLAADQVTCFAVSGLSAAHTIYLAGGNVVVLDKQGFFGGNSTKATSGINGALTRTQVEHGIQDSVKQFYDDTLKSARDKARPDLIKVLTYKSAAAVEWLQDVFNLDLTLVSRLG